MKCKIPNQDSGVTRVYIGDAMGEFYEPPGKAVQQDDGDVKFVEVREEVGDSLIHNYGYEAYDQPNDETENELNNDNSN